MKEQLEAAKQQIHSNAQYIHSSWMLEISGILFSKDEDTKGIICKLAGLAKLLNFTSDQINVAHRASPKLMAPIIALFHKNSNPNNFFQQKHKVKTLSSSQFTNDAEENLERGEPKQNIYINETLRKGNRELFKLAREEAKKTSANTNYTR